MSLDQTLIDQLITDNIETWTSTVKTKATTGRGSSKKLELYGVKKLRELILELAVRGKLVPQDPSDEPASILLEHIEEEKAQLIKEKKIKKPKKLPEISDGERLFSLPQGWVSVRWGEMAYWAIGSGFPKSAQGESGHNILFSKVSDMNLAGNEKFINTTVNTVSDEVAIKIKAKLHPKGTVVFPKIGGAIATNKRRILTCDTAIDNNCLGLTPSVGITSDYLYLILSKTDLVAYQAGTSVPALSQSTLELIVAALPPVKEQHRIVSKVDELMTLCDQLEQQTEASIEAHQVLVTTLLDTLTNSANSEELMQNWQMVAEHFDTLFITEESIDQLKQTILQLAVMGKLVPQDPNDEPAAKLLERIAEEKALLIKEKKIKKSQSTDSIIEDNCDWTLSEGWDCAELQELCRFIDYRGKNPKKSDHGVRLITAKNIRNGYIKNDPVEYISEELYEQWMVRGLPKKRDILFITEGHTMGYVAQVDLGYLFALAQRTICLQSIGDLSPEYLRIVLMSPQFQLMVKDNETGSAAGGVKASKLKRLPIPIPTLREQKIIAERVDCLLAICEQLKVQLKESQVIQLHLTDAIVEQCNPM
ncbi:restriction endonuclease subunit S [Vibrio hepatarius]|uniref:restriction endonuclease subunit S n=1 Tax=Vibrio hepatarius TaxID=171383 RepID=UPI003736E1AC